jgi:hypothetical protein
VKARRLNLGPRIGIVALCLSGLAIGCGAAFVAACAHDRSWETPRGRSTSAIPRPVPAPTTRGPSPRSTPTQAAGQDSATPRSTGLPSDITLPPVNAGFDYQLGGAYTVPRGVGVVSRDSEDSPASGVYSICYINAFQTQPDDSSWWKSEHPDLLLRGANGYVVDSEWDEILLDISTEAKRQALMKIVGPWIDGCATSGFEAVEPDNLDSWTRSGARLTQTHAVAFSRLLVSRAHAAGLAIGQKNALSLGKAARTSIGFDFAIAESCADYEMSEGVPECQGYRDVYGNHVIVIEYDDEHFDLACERFGASLSIVRRDVELSTPGSREYVFDRC